MKQKKKAYVNLKNDLLMSFVIAVTIFSCSAFIYCWQRIYIVPVYSTKVVHQPRQRDNVPPPIKPEHKMTKIVLPAIEPKVTNGEAVIQNASPKVFSYAHGTAIADGKIFIGMASRFGNAFPTNEIVVFKDDDLSRPSYARLATNGDIETMIFDAVNDQIYFLLSSNGALKLYAMDPKSYNVRSLASTSAIDAGQRPAIVTDGRYVYGITDTASSTVFKVDLKNGTLTYSDSGHISKGHSAAIEIYGSSTELYFGGGMSNGFEKVDALTLRSTASTTISPCAMSDDMPFVKASDSSGYVYIGCEGVPYGVKVKTSDLSFERFSLPGSSFGLFVYGNNLYNGAKDGNIDIFPNFDLKDLHRYRVIGEGSPLEYRNLDLEVNEIFYSEKTGKLFVTAWWGVPGLFEVSTSTGQK